MSEYEILNFKKNTKNHLNLLKLLNRICFLLQV